MQKSLYYLIKEVRGLKKDSLSDVTMGAYDGEEVCQLVRTFLLDKISKKYDKNSIGLHRDDGLSVFINKSDTQLERIKKELTKNIQGLWFRNSGRI